MKKTIVRYAAYCFLVLMCSTLLSAQQSALDSARHPVSVFVNYGAVRTVSASMQESIEDFRKDLWATYNNTGYPFQPSQVGHAWSAQLGLGYALSDEHTSLITSFSYATLFTDASPQVRLANYALRDEAEMNIWSIALGAEETLFQHTNSWNVFGRAAIVANMIGGHTRVSTSLPNDGVFVTNTKVPYVGRFGCSAELGLRLFIPGTRIALEAGAEYSVANLLGKTFVPFGQTAPNDNLFERELNDAKNPNDANDHDRTIDMLRFKVGIQVLL